MRWAVLLQLTRQKSEKEQARVPLRTATEMSCKVIVAALEVC
jgi:hypothetical protein